MGEVTKRSCRFTTLSLQEHTCKSRRKKNRFLFSFFNVIGKILNNSSFLFFVIFVSDSSPKFLKVLYALAGRKKKQKNSCVLCSFSSFFLVQL